MSVPIRFFGPVPTNSGVPEFASFPSGTPNWHDPDLTHEPGTFYQPYSIFDTITGYPQNYGAVLYPGIDDWTTLAYAGKPIPIADAFEPMARVRRWKVEYKVQVTDALYGADPFAYRITVGGTCVFDTGISAEQNIAGLKWVGGIRRDPDDPMSLYVIETDTGGGSGTEGVDHFTNDYTVLGLGPTLLDWRYFVTNGISGANGQANTLFLLGIQNLGGDFSNADGAQQMRYVRIGPANGAAATFDYDLSAHWPTHLYTKSLVKVPLSDTSGYPPTAIEEIPFGGWGIRNFDTNYTITANGLAFNGLGGDTHSRVRVTPDTVPGSYYPYGGHYNGTTG